MNETTLVLAYDNEDRPRPQSITLFVCRHEAGIDVRGALGAAFRAWANTREGADYVGGNGTNWGDATAIPARFLRAAGIRAYDNPAVTTLAKRGLLTRIPALRFHHQVVVDHNESLL